MILLNKITLKIGGLRRMRRMRRMYSTSGV
jgi:hypothetical protein